MILIGQYDSPFVRRVAIALHLYELPYEHRPWSTFSDADQIARFNPLRRVPTLVLESDETLIESTVILDYVDALVGPAKALIPPSGEPRRRGLKVCMLATGLSDKAFSLLYERLMHRDVSQAWVQRCETQIADALDVLEGDRASQTAPFWFGDSVGHPDIAMACAMRFIREAHPGIVDDQRWPALAEHALRCESLAPFQAIQQPFTLPAR